MTNRKKGQKYFAKAMPIFIAATLFLSACARIAAPPSNASVSPTEVSAPLSVTTAVNSELNLDDWASILATAKGQTVNWYLWGGSDSINRFVDDFYGKALKERYDITLKRIPLADTVDAVNQVLSEKQAGKAIGAVDLIWINGENFYSLKQAKMLSQGWARKLPNSRFVNWENPAINRDFGEAIDDMESPWSSAQLQLIYDSARMKADTLPRSYKALKDWMCAHPGRFTYIAPGPGGFMGTRFIKGALYEISGDAAQWSTFNQASWDKWAPELWRYFNEMKPCLWRKGETYPKDENELQGLFANNEIDFSMTQAVVGAGALIKAGTVPYTSRAFVFDHDMIGDFNYVAIPSNAPNKAAALVLANLILDPELQAAQILPENGFGLGYGIDVTKVTDPDAKAKLEEASKALGEAATPASDLAKALVGDAAVSYQSLIEQEWRKNVLIGK